MDGIQIAGTSVGPQDAQSYVGNTIEGNFIGTDATGKLAVANHANGIELISGATANVIGTSSPGAGNTISFNGEDGILVNPGTPSGGMGVSNNSVANTIWQNKGAGVHVLTGTNNLISQNSIYENGDLRHQKSAWHNRRSAHQPDMQFHGAAGANNLQNYPALTGSGGSGILSLQPATWILNGDTHRSFQTPSRPRRATTSSP